MTSPSTDYQPGVCNIGGAETANRRRIGIGGAFVTIVLAAGLLAFGAPWWSMIVVALPAFVAATGFIQARSRFCAGYGMSGMSNFGAMGAGAARTEVDEFLTADRARARAITRQSAVIGIVVAALLVAVAVLV